MNDFDAFEEWNPNGPIQTILNPAVSELPIYDDAEVSFRDLNALSWSRLKRFIDDPAYFLRKPNRETSTVATELGTYLHCALLEPERCAETYRQFCPPINPNTGKPFKSGVLFDKALEEFVSSGSMPLTDDMLEAKNEIFNQLETYDLRSLFYDGKSEVPLYVGADENELGLALKGRVDFYREDIGVVDLKTTGKKLRTFGKDYFRWTANDFGNVYELAYYAHIIEARTGFVPRCQIVAAQTIPPYQVGLYEIGPEQIERAWETIRDEYVPLWKRFAEGTADVKEFKPSILGELYA